MIDTHCHLSFDDYSGRVGEVLSSARRAGVTGAITISTTSEDCRLGLALAREHAGLWCSSGVHPLYSDRGHLAGGGHDWSAVGEVASDGCCVAWGELGLDGHYAEPDFLLQRRVLEEQLSFISGHAASPANGADGKPVVVHCREAFDALIPVLEGSGLPAERFVFHCFTGGPGEMEKVLEFGAYVSFTGVLTYKNAGEVREAAAMAPVDRVMVETDAPFLSPQAVRRVRPNEPRFVVHVAAELARVKGLDLEAMHARLNETTRGFFGVDVEDGVVLDVEAASSAG